MSTMPSSDYNRYLAAIKAANDSADKDAAPDPKTAYRHLWPRQ